MPVHDWTRVEAGIFHAFHHDWITEIARALNRGILPSDYYALPEQIVSGRGPDVLTLQRPANGSPTLAEPEGGVALATSPPRVHMHLRSEPDLYAAKTKTVVVRHASNHQVIAVAEVVSSGNKNSRNGLRNFVSKAMDLLRAGVHLLIVDLFPPGPRDPHGIHRAIWDELVDNEFSLPPERPLTLAADSAGAFPEAFLEFTAVNESLPDMPLFLSLGVYVSVPLETTYQSAFAGLPSYWRDVLNSLQS